MPSALQGLEFRHIVITIDGSNAPTYIVATYTYPFEENASIGLFPLHSKCVGEISGPPALSHHCFCSAAASGAMQEMDISPWRR